MSLHPRAGVDYPRSAGEFRAWFGTDADCLDYLDWLRWPHGFVCPRCTNAGGWAVADGGYTCASCGARTAVTAGTLFDRRRTPLTVWFEACWMFASQLDGAQTSVGAGFGLAARQATVAPSCVRRIDTCSIASGQGSPLFASPNIQWRTSFLLENYC